MSLYLQNKQFFRDTNLS